MRSEFKSSRPKKSLGQSFLRDNRIIEKIIDSCQFGRHDTVLEIGPGHGELTGKILEHSGRVIVVEIDSGLCEALDKNLGSSENLEIINRDILKFDINKYFKSCSGKIRVIGNIPYYITTPIIEHLFVYLGKIEDIFLTVQKEFARRIVSSPGSREYGSFSCFTQYHTDPRLLFYIKKGSFHPSPKVDSAFLRLKVRNKPAVEVLDEVLLFKIIRRAFNQRRKKITNSLKGIVTPQALESFFLRYGLDREVRPERLSLQDFANLANLISC